jgi:GT2 family glycosyltransferase
MIKKLKQISIVLISYNSSTKLIRFVKKIPKNSPILIIDNSKDFELKKIFKKNKNIRIYFKKNMGYGSSINYASKKINTKYFFVVQPDVKGINKKALITFYNYAENLKEKFSVIGPHYIKAPKSGHYQTNLKYDIKKIHNVHGSTIFFNKMNFIKNKGFDPNIFLYWEETDYTKRARKNGYNAFQLNKVKVFHEKGKAVGVSSSKEEKQLIYLYGWHFIWSKYYFFKKHFGFIFSIIYFLPILIRSLVKFSYFQLTSNNEKKRKYLIRLDGLLTSIVSKKSYKRIKN